MTLEPLGLALVSGPNAIRSGWQARPKTLPKEKYNKNIITIIISIIVDNVFQKTIITVKTLSDKFNIIINMINIIICILNIIIFIVIQSINIKNRRKLKKYIITIYHYYYG